MKQYLVTVNHADDYHPEPAEMDAIGADVNALNEQILISLQRGGSSYLSNAIVNKHFALRGCVLNYQTTERDMEILLEDVRKAARATINTCQVSGSVQRAAANPARSGRKQR